MREERHRRLSEIEQAVDDFCARSEVAPATRRYYRESLVNVFLPWARDEDLVDLRELTPDVVERYAVDLEERRKRDNTPLSVATRRAYLRALRQLLGWARKRRGITEIDEKALALPTQRRKQLEVLTAQEKQALEDAAPIERDKLIVRIMSETGARLGEVMSIRTGDLIERDRRYHFLRVRGKTGERLTTISPQLYRRLKDYAEGRSGRPMRSGHSNLFMAHRRRNQGDFEPLTEDGIYQVVKDAAERAGLRRRVHPHLFRHTRITELVAAGVNALTISEELGVSVAIISQHYLHQTAEQRHEAVMKALAVG